MHFMVLVALPPEIAQEDVAVAVQERLARYDVNVDTGERADEADADDNPHGKWDGYVIGGRWSDRMKIRSGCDLADLVLGERSGDDDPPPEDRCDGGRLRALDLDYVRDEVGESAGRLWDEYQRVISGTPKPRPVGEFDARAEAAQRAATPSLPERLEQATRIAAAAVGLDPDTVRRLNPDSAEYEAYRARHLDETRRVRREYEAETYTLQQARADYHAQPRIARLREHFDSPVEFWLGDLSREEFVRARRDWAIHGAGFVTVDGQWLEPADDNDDESREHYRRAADDQLASLPDDAWLVIVDTHL